MFDLIPFDRRSRDLSNIFDQFEKRMLGGFAQTLGDFRTDILEEDDKYVLQAELPGFRREDISVDVSGDRLTISAKHESCSEDEKPANGERRGYIHRERCWGSYSRSFSISNIQRDAISAAYEDGILTVNLPKVAPKKPETTKIEIR